MPIATPKGLAIAATGCLGSVAVIFIAAIVGFSGYPEGAKSLALYVATPLYLIGLAALLTLPSRGK